VRGVIPIVDDDGTGFKRHASNLSYSLFVRPSLAWASRSLCVLLGEGVK
jgi:hypothetical protein